MRHFGSVVVLAALAGCGRVEPLTEEPTELTSSEEQMLSELQLSIDEAALDKATSPCDDFYRFACGGFLDATTLKSPNDERSRAFESVSTANAETVTQLLRGQGSPATADDALLANIWNSCVQARTTPVPAAQLEAKLAAAVNPYHVERHLQGMGKGIGRATLLAPISPFLGSIVGMDRLDGTRTALYVFPGSTWFSGNPADLVELYPAMSPAELSARAALLKAVSDKMEQAQGALDFTLHPIGMAGLATVMPSVDWGDFLEVLGVTKWDDVIVFGLDGLHAMDALMSTLSPAEVDAWFDLFYRSFLHGHFGTVNGTSLKEAQDYCESWMPLLPQIDAVVQARFFDTLLGKKNASVATAMIKKVKQTFAARLANTPFLDLSTLTEAQAKLKAMRETPLKPAKATLTGKPIGSTWAETVVALTFENRAREVATVDSPWSPTRLSSPFITNAFYSPARNQFEIAPGILHGAFFAPDAGKAMNFGAIGWVIAHEMTHGFDNNGRQFDAQGRQRNWWSSSVETEFNNRAQCLVNQYSAFPVPEVVDASGNVAHLDGQLTLGENIADNGGIRIAYDAASSYFASQKNQKGFTPAQQFFLAGAQLWCSKLGSSAASARLRFDSHASNRARVNAVFSNFEGFAQAFQCSAGAKMVSAAACQVW